MKNTGIMVFFTIVFTIYSLINFYIVFRGFKALPRVPARGWFLAIAIALILAYPLGRIAERLLGKFISEPLIHTGSYYLSVMVYALLLVLLIDLVRTFNAFLHFWPSAWQGYRTSVPLFFAVLTISLVVTIAGAINAAMPRLRTLEIKVDKQIGGTGPLTVLLATDIHLGTIIHRPRMEKIKNIILAEKPDMILLAGDVFDEDVNSIMEKNTVGVLAELKAPLGTYAILGNHEYYAGVEGALQVFKQAGITVLRDSVADIGGFYLAGRDDRTRNQWGSRRKTLPVLLGSIDRSKMIIVMDHQPFHLEEPAAEKIDLQVSGHTHHGQLFPFNFITKKVYELSWGYLQKGTSNFYVSCGVGTWGPPVRIGNRPEIVKIIITGRNGAI